MSSWKVAAGKSPESEHGPSERDGGVWPGPCLAAGREEAGELWVLGGGGGRPRKGLTGDFTPNSRGYSGLTGKPQNSTEGLFLGLRHKD